VPIKDNDSITGVLYSALEMDVLCKILDNVKQGNPYSSFIINKKGTLIADESHSNLLLKENLLDTAMKDPAQRQFAKILKKMTEGKSGTGQCYYRGVKSYIAFNPIAGTDWSIAVTITKSHAFENLNSIALFIVILVAFITFLIIFHSLYTKFLESKLSIEKSNTAKVIEAANIIVIYMNSNGKNYKFQSICRAENRYLQRGRHRKQVYFQHYSSQRAREN
jgi:methyl-accepting chemotaxis protein